MEIYHVGGSVRDTLLNNTVHDHDFVVVGATFDEMIAAGFKHIDATSFPVFHDANANEYALARIERKVGNGYHGFESFYEPTVTLEDDLSRRDLTCNSMAVKIADWEEFTKTKNIELVIDPFCGLTDIMLGVLRHTSDAFAEDPVRILRVARFAARYDHMQIAEPTLNLMELMVSDGEVDHLVPERVWAETAKAIMETNPLKYFRLLDECGALERVIPGLTAEQYNSVTFRELHNVTYLDKVLTATHRWMLLTCSFQHEEDIESMLLALKTPNDVVKACLTFHKLIRLYHEYATYDNKHIALFNILHELNFWNDKGRFEELGAVVFFYGINDTNFKKFAISVAHAFDIANAACFNKLTALQQRKLKGKEIGEAIRSLRFDLLWEKYKM